VSIAFLFPGDGSQFPGMLHQLLDYSEVERTLNEVNSVLHSDVRDLDSEEALESTVWVQLALLIAGVATARALIAKDAEPAVVCGLSIGAFAAAVVADVLSLKDAVELVQLRAERMMELYPTGYGLSAVVGLNEPQVLKIVQAATSEQEPVFIANINAPRQIVIAGSDPGMERVLDQARHQGARKAERLGVSVSIALSLAAARRRLLAAPFLFGAIQQATSDLRRQRKRTRFTNCGTRRERSREQCRAYCPLARCRDRCQRTRLQSLS
jgi:malonate decarboxylase epsilon subunit